MLASYMSGWVTPRKNDNGFMIRPDMFLVPVRLTCPGMSLLTMTDMKVIVMATTIGVRLCVTVESGVTLKSTSYAVSGLDRSAEVMVDEVKFMSATVIRTAVNSRLELVVSRMVCLVCPLFLLVLRLSMVCPVAARVTLDTEKQLPTRAKMRAATRETATLTGSPLNS